MVNGISPALGRTSRVLRSPTQTVEATRSCVECAARLPNLSAQHHYRRTMHRQRCSTEPLGLRHLDDDGVVRADLSSRWGIDTGDRPVRRHQHHAVFGVGRRQLNLGGPRPSSFDWAISAFSLIKSPGMVICPADAAADDEGAAGSGAKAGAEAVADGGCVTVTVAGAAGFSLLQDETNVATTPAAINKAAVFMKAG